MSRFPENRRPAFERVVINRMAKSGFSEFEVHVECLAKGDNGVYFDGSIQAYWEFWNAALDSLPKHEPVPVSPDDVGILRAQRDKLASLLSSIVENIDEIEYGVCSITSSEDFDVAEVVAESRKTIELVQRGDA